VQQHLRAQGGALSAFSGARVRGGYAGCQQSRGTAIQQKCVDGAGAQATVRACPKHFEPTISAQQSNRAHMVNKTRRKGRQGVLGHRQRTCRCYEKCGAPWSSRCSCIGVRRDRTFPMRTGHPRVSDILLAAARALHTSELRKDASRCVCARLITYLSHGVYIACRGVYASKRCAPLYLTK
jgi:hypothetical protein